VRGVLAASLEEEAGVMSSKMERETEEERESEDREKERERESEGKSDTDTQTGNDTGADLREHHYLVGYSCYFVAIATTSDNSNNMW